MGDHLAQPLGQGQDVLYLEERKESREWKEGERENREKEGNEWIF